MSDLIRSVFEYDPATGVVTWKYREDMPRQWNVRYAGKTAGTKRPGTYVRVRLNGKIVYAHRIAWAFIGEGNPRDIDHINGDRSDNRAINLRAATRSQNLANTKNRPYRGVSYATKRKKYVAQIVCQGKHYWLGEHDTPEAAARAYRAKAIELFGEFACSPQ